MTGEKIYNKHMFSWQHFVWLGISAIFIAVILTSYKKKHPALNQVLTSACVICVFSELGKIFSAIEMVPTANGAYTRPYLPLNHLPFHLCSILIIFIFYSRLSTNEKRRENVLAFLCPAATIGAIFALILPSIFSTTITVDRAFTSLQAYQFFIYHSMLVTLGIIIIQSHEINWRKSHIIMTIGGLWFLSYCSIYLNAIFASPTYVDGELQSVDFTTNFFFTYLNPLGIELSEKWQWILYILCCMGLSATLITGFYQLFIFRRKKK